MRMKQENSGELEINSKGYRHKLSSKSKKRSFIPTVDLENYFGSCSSMTSNPQKRGESAEMDTIGQRWKKGSQRIGH